MKRLEILLDDITHLKVDAIVNGNNCRGYKCEFCCLQ